MGKWMGGLGFCVVLSSLASAWGQDPFSAPTYESEPQMEASPALILEAPPIQPQEAEPIIQTLPAQKPTHRIAQRPLTSRKENAQVRTTRTPAENYIHQRAVFEAQQRTARMQLRKWRGESLLRPSHNPENTGWYEATLPVWTGTYTR